MTAMQYGHYTSISGLMGIVEKEIIWATNIKFLNDAQEFQHALDLIKNLIPRAQITPAHSHYDAHQKFVEKITDRLGALDEFQPESVFTLSFSEETDLLSQWRGYCPHYNGYCIVFDVELILAAIKEKFSQARIVSCVYDETHKESKLRDLLNSHWENYTKSENEPVKDEILNYLANELAVLASHFKHSSFAEEKEHRIVVFLDYANTEPLRFREGRHSLIPYLELPAPRRAIRRVCIGPTTHKDLARKSLKSFFDKCFDRLPNIGDEPEISFSATPFRPW